MSLTNEEVVSFLRSLDKESKAIREDILTICWQMRGSISYDDGMLLSDEDRTIINKITNNNAKITKETGLPYF